MDMAEEAREFFAANPDIEVLEAFVIDVNGVPRGKWIPRERAIDVLTKGMAMPRSVYALDVWGRDVNAAGLAEGTGDPDGICFPVPGTLSRVTWLFVIARNSSFTYKGRAVDVKQMKSDRKAAKAAP